MTSPPPSGPDAAASIADTVAVIGAGSIGIAWTIVFASAGIRVRIFEAAPGVRRAAIGEVTNMLGELSEAGLLDEPVATILERVQVVDSLEAAVSGADFVQECVIEDLGVKQQLFAQLDALTDPRVVLASSTSTITASAFAAGLAGRERCLVVHPANPPYFLRVAEVVPASFTAASTVATARALLVRARMTPIVLGREIEGFAFNRLQGAMLREAYCLVRDGVVSAEDIDTLVREGLGLRWSVIGPFTTSEPQHPWWAPPSRRSPRTGVRPHRARARRRQPLEPRHHRTRRHDHRAAPAASGVGGQRPRAGPRHDATGVAAAAV
ncbi:3-hydroxyacyl-CoA dehydrogenase NAD-binding domain-containing protein [Microbacterium sp. ET2]|uniref:3-hydroxyacyl-CoA dehydrogenase NAD-binding domain-containing protein n=1 Tax=Microbacterium albipurpureum TaxID=3050384 RepID=UPI00259CFB26|nr:3-hydroxyacyl-CoA dehydrogenase NAD-binding domain-containing protein [Microbacterium sp. ET2 (Ac-2212)]WJL96346.1 3-hydroxyacyl-CoA dehydrogenase NAD-binding domain-containing protein [Microbacterium sp. ET2 (Ac-2212)]